MMEFVNAAYKEATFSRSAAEALILLLAPYAPHLAEEIWRGVLGKKTSIHQSEWPVFDPERIKEDTFTLILQVNGKVRDSVQVPAGISEKEAEKLALGSEKIKAFLRSASPKRVIYVPGRLINIVV